MKKNRLIALVMVVMLVAIIFVVRNGTVNTQEEALEQARNFEGGNCTTVETPARHITSGATYTFPSGCIPDGWETVRN